MAEWLNNLDDTTRMKSLPISKSMDERLPCPTSAIGSKPRGTSPT